MNDFLCSLRTTRSGPYEVRQLSLLGGLVRLKDAVPHPPHAVSEAPNTYRLMVVLGWVLAFSGSYTDTYGDTAELEVRLLGLALSLSLSLYPSLP